jgi:hypothetical protein
MAEVSTMHKDLTEFYFPMIAAGYHGIQMRNKSSNFKKCNACKTTLCVSIMFFFETPTLLKGNTTKF